MKFTIDIEDFWMDDESGGVAHELEKYITREVVSKIYKSIEKKLEDTIVVKIDSMVTAALYRKSTAFIKKFLERGMIKARVRNEHGNMEDGEITIEDFIKSKFQNDSGWSSPNDRIEKLAKGFAEDMKNRYDLLFATQIVSKLGEQNLLKDSVMKELVENIMNK